MNSWFLVPMMLGAALVAFPRELGHRSCFLRLALAADQPNISQLAVDSLGNNKLDQNLMLPPAVAAATRYEVASKGRTDCVSRGGIEGAPAWSFEISDRAMVIRSAYSAKNPPDPLVLSFDPIRCHATLLGLFNDEGGIRFPALLHFPDHGTFRITSAAKAICAGI